MTDNDTTTMPLSPRKQDGLGTHSQPAAPSSEFILRRILKNDMQGTPGWGLNAEMRGEFTRMLREREEKKGRGR